MRKHHLRESIKSFFGSHVDPEKDEELKGTKTEIEDKVQKILNLIKEEDEDEKGGNTVGKSKKEPLVELIEDFHKHYQSLYARYDHLTGELREKVHGKQEKDTFSSSGSDSDSDYSSKEQGSKNGKLQNEFQKVTDDIKQELQSAHLEVADLKRKLTETTEEKEALHLEYQTALNKIQEAEKMISDLKMEAEMLNGENSKLLLEIRDLNQRLDGASMLEAELNQKLEDITRERTDLLVEKETALQRIKEGEKIIEELKVVTNQLNDEKKTLQLELEDLKGILCTTKDQLECSEQEVANLIQAQKATEEQNSSLSSKILELSSEINGAQDKIQELVTKSSQLGEKLGEREKELASHTEMHETHKSETSAQMRGLELELDSLHTQKGEIEKQKADELSSLLKKLEEKEKDSLSQIEDMTTWINNLQLVLEVETLQTQKSKLEEQLVRDSNEASGQVKGLLDKVNEKQKELETLNSQKIEFEFQLEKKILEMSEYLVRIGTLEEESEKNIADQRKMIEEKEGLMVQVKDLERELDFLQNQNSDLEEQLRSKNQETDQMLAEKERLQDRISELENELSALQKKSKDGEDEASAQITTLAAQVNDLKMEVDSLHAQKAESESHIENKAQEITQFLVQIENLKEELANKAMDGQRMMEERQSLTMQVKDLEEQMENKNQDIDHLRQEKEGLQERISELEKTLVEQEESSFTLQKQVEDVRNEASAQIMALTTQVNDLQQELDSTHSAKSQLVLQIERCKQESSESLTQVENQNSELANKVADQQRMLKEQEDAFNELREEHKRLEVLFQECKANLEVAERKIEEMEEELQKSIDSKDRKVDELEETIEDLKRDLEMKGDEVSMLIENVSTIEVKLRLSNQKLRVTEQLLTENEESHRKKEEKFQQEQRLLEERIARLSGAIATYKEAQVKIIKVIWEKVNNTMTGLDTVMLKFEEDYGHFESRVCEILNELQVAKNWVNETNTEKQQLKDELSVLIEQLRDKKEKELVLRERIRELEAKLHNTEDEKQNLIKNFKMLEEKIGELEKTMSEKDEGILGLGEEKREAIRQLCIWIDYHRSRCEDLKEMLSKVLSGRRPIAT
ncbi:hypothetical protein ACSBR2_041241 [Camellia fascicularis]